MPASLSAVAACLLWGATVIAGAQPPGQDAAAPNPPGAAEPDALEARAKQQMAESDKHAKARQGERVVELMKALVAEMEAAWGKDPSDAARRELLAGAYGRLGWGYSMVDGHDDEELAAIDQAIRLKPDGAYAHFARGMFFSRPPEFRDMDEAAKEFEAATRLDPKQPYAWFKLGECVESRQPARAVEAYRKAVELDPKNVRALTRLGHMAEDRDEALALFRRAAEADPTAADPRYQIARVYRERGRHEEALAEYRAGLRFGGPLESLFREGVIVCLDELGRVKERDAERAALRDLRKAGKVTAERYPLASFRVGGEDVFAEAYFEPKGDQPPHYRFSLIDAKKHAPRVQLVLFGNQQATRAARERKEIGPDDQVFQLDRSPPAPNPPAAERKTFAVYKKEPTYDEVKALVVKVLEGTAEPIDAEPLKAPQ